jgi:deoxyribose-phosphate aldolase
VSSSTYDNVRRASWLSPCELGVTSSRPAPARCAPAATLPVTVIMLEAVRDWLDLTGEMVGVKPAGGIKTSKDAIKFLVAVNEVAGEAWLDNHWFRFGASSLLNDLLLQRQRMTLGYYSGADYITDDAPSLY